MRARRLNACREKTVNHQSRDRPELMRMIESWLPLAQEANGVYGWGYDAATLEHLLLTAATDLGQARTTWEARAILWYIYHLQQEAT